MLSKAILTSVTITEESLQKLLQWLALSNNLVKLVEVKNTNKEVPDALDEGYITEYIVL